MKKLDFKKYDVEWEYMNYDFNSIIFLCILMPAYCFCYLDILIFVFSPICIEVNYLIYIIPYLIVNIFASISLIYDYVDGYRRQQIVKSNKCKDCECYIPEAFNGLEACTYVGKFKEDGSVDYTLPCELNKSIDKQSAK